MGKNQEKQYDESSEAPTKSRFLEATEIRIHRPPRDRSVLLGLLACAVALAYIGYQEKRLADLPAGYVVGVPPQPVERAPLELEPVMPEPPGVSTLLHFGQLVTVQGRAYMVWLLENGTHGLKPYGVPDKDPSARRRADKRPFRQVSLGVAPGGWWTGVATLPSTNGFGRFVMLNQDAQLLVVYHVKAGTANGSGVELVEEARAVLPPVDDYLPKLPEGSPAPPPDFEVLPLPAPEPPAPTEKPRPENTSSDREVRLPAFAIGGPPSQ